MAIDAQHQTVWMQGVLYCEALAQEFRIPCDLYINSGRCELASSHGQSRSSTHRNRGFSEDHSRLLQQRRQLINHCIHVCQIGSKLALLLGCTYTQKMDVCEGRSLVVRRREAQTSGSDVR